MSCVRAAALFSALTIAATYPIAIAPHSYAFFDHPDAQLNMWIMAWDAHVLPRQPQELFNANIFFPHRHTLAYSETLLGYLPIFGPILWLGGTPALAFNVVLLFSFAASAFAMYLLARHLTGREWPALVAGIAYAFVPYRLAHIPQIQLESMEWLPLAFLSLHLFVERRRFRYAVGLAVCLALSALCCVYYGVFLATTLLVACALLALVDPRMRQVRTIVPLAGAFCLAALTLAPVVGEYERVHQRTGLERPLDEVARKAADAEAYLASGAPVHQALGVPPGRQAPRDYLFPGVLALAFATLGLVTSRRSTSILYAAVAAFGVLASFGPEGLGAGFSVYAPLYHLVPVFHGLRQVSRFGVIALFAIAVLAADGCAFLESRLPQSRRTAWQIVLGACVFLELFSAPLRRDQPAAGGVPLVHVPEPPAVYSWLAEQPDKFAVLELPMADDGQLWRNARYVYWSTVHWHGLVDGYSGFAPNGYERLREAVQSFPGGRSRAILSRHRVRYVVIHWDKYTPADPVLDRRAIRDASWLRTAARFGQSEVLEVLPDEWRLTRNDAR